MKINIKQELEETLNKLANERNKKDAEYVEDFVNSHLLSQYKNSIFEKIQVEKIENLSQIDIAITSRKAELKEAFDLANPLVNEKLTNPDLI